MRRLRSTLLLATLMVAGIVGASATPVSADDGGAAVTSDVFGVPLDQFLGEYPDAKPLADGSYQLAPGVRLSPPAPRSTSSAAALGSCATEWVCFYQHSDFGG
jgi:hypothetical protein